MKRSKISRNSGLWKLFDTSPISLVRPVVRLEASALGQYPSSSAAAITLARVSLDTEAPSVKVRETAERDTPARAATSFKVTAIRPGPCNRRLQGARLPF